MAMDRVARMCWGGATRRRDLAFEMDPLQREGRTAAAEKLAIKINRQMRLHGVWKPGLPVAPTQEAKARLAEWEVQAERDLVKRRGREAPEPLLDIGDEEWIMIATWLRWGTAGQPGLCYYSDEAMADLLTLISKQEGRYGLGTRTIYYRKLRQRLGLEHACYRTPLVTRARLTSTGRIQIEGQFKQRTVHETLRGIKIQIPVFRA